MGGDRSPRGERAGGQRRTDGHGPSLSPGVVCLRHRPPGRLLPCRKRCAIVAPWIKGARARLLRDGAGRRRPTARPGDRRGRHGDRRHHVPDRAREPTKQLTLDLRAVTFFDSAAIHAVVRLAQRFPDALTVLPSPQVRRVLDISGLGDQDWLARP
ncbi:STAS domain-containing protein [Micromonospora sp. BRA006-A]|nr:STAS domain-containing protein [Micromonospora sp. BRA006-A]